MVFPSPHLRQVALTAGRLAAALGEDIESAIVAGFLHDCGRTDDGGGTCHAYDSSIIARKAIAALDPHLDVDRLCDGIARHADGDVTQDALIGCLWDADRLDLTRIGVDPDPDLLSTPVARRMVRLARRRRREREKKTALDGARG